MSRQLDPPYSYDNLCVVLESAPPRLWHDGMVWYEQAHEWCKGFDLDVREVAAIVAVFSRNTGWEQNLIMAKDFIKGRPVGHFKPCLAQAHLILDGHEPLSVLTGRKIRAFYDNIANPMESQAITIDRHAAALLAGMPTPQFIREYKSALENQHLHRKACEIYTRAARERGIMPHEAQAVSWLTHRESQ